jgi:hypothetical protein
VRDREEAALKRRRTPKILELDAVPPRAGPGKVVGEQPQGNGGQSGAEQGDGLGAEK